MRWFASILMLCVFPLGSLAVAHAAAIPESSPGAGVPSPAIPRADPLDALAGPPSSQFT